METFKNKYIKYKTKYLKHNQKGGKPKLIIHISGPSGAGKTTLGNKLLKKFKNNIIVKDIDDLRKEFINEHYGDKEWNDFDKDAYQQYINDYIGKQNKPLIFVGLNNMPWWHEDLYYDMNPTHKFYIDIPDELVIKQKCMRVLHIEKDEMAMNDMINDNKKFIEIITRRIKKDCDAEKTIKFNKKWNKYYQEQGYEILSRRKIYKTVCKILSK